VGKTPRLALDDNDAAALAQIGTQMRSRPGAGMHALLCLAARPWPPTFARSVERNTRLAWRVLSMQRRALWLMRKGRHAGALTMIRDARTRLLTLSLPLLMETDLGGQVSNAWIPVRSGVDHLLCDTRRRILLDHDQRQRCA
jgi:hypothetical protein